MVLGKADLRNGEPDSFIRLSLIGSDKRKISIYLFPRR